MLLGVMIIPVIFMPVAVMTPIPPVIMKIMVANSIIPGRHIEDVVRWNHNNWRWYKIWLNDSPWMAVMGCPEPIAPMKAIPVSSIKVEPNGTWYHINVAWSARNDHYIGRCREYYWRRKANVYLNICCGHTRKNAHHKHQYCPQE
jgi:hypothetical protein